MTETEASNQLVVKHDQVPGALATVLGVSPKELMNYAIEIADTLTDVLRKKGMTRKFGAGEHVQTEGWQLAGSLMGFTTDEGECRELDDGSYEATVHLKSTASGRIVATATGRCGTDEPNWKTKPKYARRSMAFTRAIGRAYAQNFRWLIKLAGYEGTPAEEMPTHDAEPEVYQEKDYQKMELVQHAKKHGIETKEDLVKLSAACKGVRMSSLANAVAEYANGLS